MNRFYLILLLFLAGFPWETSCQRHPEREEELKNPATAEALIQIEQWRLNAVHKIIGTDSLEFQQRLPKQYNLKKIQQDLIRYRPHVAIVSYYVHNGIIHLHFIHRNTFYHQATPYPETLAQDIQTINDQIDGKTPENYATYTQASERIYNTLIAPIAEIGNGFEWLIIPHNTIEEINFGALIVPPAPTSVPPENRGWTQATFLADDVTIAYGLSMLMVLENLTRPEHQYPTYYVSDSTSSLVRFFQQNQLVPARDTIPALIGHIKSEMPLPNQANLLTIEKSLEDLKPIYFNTYLKGIKTAVFTTSNPTERTYESLMYDFYCYYLEMRAVPYAFRSAQQNFIGHPDYSAPKYWAKYKVWGL